MEEKVLNKSKNGMAMLLLTLLLYAAALAATIVGSITGISESGPQSPTGIALFAIGLIWLLFGWIPFLGLVVLRPQEAVVLNLNGHASQPSSPQGGITVLVFQQLPQIIFIWVAALVEGHACAVLPAAGDLRKQKTH